jgi:Fe-S-cluster-containing dehydrogenase component
MKATDKKTYSDLRKAINDLIVVQDGCEVELHEEETFYAEPPKVSGKCTGCKICEAICSFTHFKIVNPDLAAIHVVKKENDWVKKKAKTIFRPTICRQCKGLPPCMAVCPMLHERALYRDPETGVVLVNHKVCIKCKSCVRACPYKAIRFSERRNEIIKCDLCGGKPKCVEWCPPKVLQLVKTGESVL